MDLQFGFMYVAPGLRLPKSTLHLFAIKSQEQEIKNES